MLVPEKPGLGIALDEEAIAARDSRWQAFLEADPHGGR
jgi:L-alanine-DL-glutamate epimerase-like enolase superfamily enzyme